MYRDRPKSPNFTQSTVDTNTFRAAMSLERKQQNRKSKTHKNCILCSTQHIQVLTVFLISWYVCTFKLFYCCITPSRRWQLWAVVIDLSAFFTCVIFCKIMNEVIQDAPIHTCEQSVCSPDKPGPCWAGKSTRWGWPSRDCTSSPGEMTVTVEKRQERGKKYESQNKEQIKYIIQEIGL